MHQWIIIKSSQAIYSFDGLLIHVESKNLIYWEWKKVFFYPLTQQIQLISATQTISLSIVIYVWVIYYMTPFVWLRMETLTMLKYIRSWLGCFQFNTVYIPIFIILYYFLFALEYIHHIITTRKFSQAKSFGLESCY